MTEPTSHASSHAPGEFERWLLAARDGSHDDLGRALEACRGYLLIMAESELGSTIRPKAGASDLVQESLLDAHRGFGQFRGRSRAEFLAWVEQILRFNLADLGRRYRGAALRSVAREELLTGAVPETRTDAQPDQLVATETAARLHSAVAELPDEARTVITWRHQEGLGWEEIGSRLGKSAEAARKVWFRAVERLRKTLGADHESGER